MTSVIDDPVLVLNRNWQSVTFLPVKTAITQVMRDMASVLDTKDYLLCSFEEWADHHHKNPDEVEEARWIRTPSMKILAPEVVVLKRYGERPPRKVSFNRPNLAKRDQHTCQYCGVALPMDDLTIEHVFPRSRGGPTTWENCVAACTECNSRKADQTPKEAGMRLKTTPVKPNWKSRIRLPRGAAPRASWVPFLEKEIELGAAG